MIQIIGLEVLRVQDLQMLYLEPISYLFRMNHMGHVDPNGVFLFENRCKTSSRSIKHA